MLLDFGSSSFEIYALGAYWRPSSHPLLVSVGGFRVSGPAFHVFDGVFDGVFDVCGGDWF